MKTPHIHAALIKAWADGAEIEYLNVGANSVWDVAKSPRWDGHGEYRIKSEPKPDVVEQYFASGSVFRQRLHHPQCLAYGLVCNSARVADMKEALKRALEALEEPKEHIAKHLRIEAITAIKAALAQEQEPVGFTSLLREAEETVQSKPTWKRFIDGTPLSNDIAVWMAVFAQDVARRNASQPAQQEPVAWMDRDGNFSDNNDHKCFPIPLYTITHPIPPQQEPLVWKLVPTEPTEEMLKAMDECSTEGYDERLYAGHAASVYMAAIDATPTPPQRTEERNFCPRCGKRTADLTVIHTCTPPRGNT